MADNNHPITPPPELVQQWLEDSPEDDEFGIAGYIATQAARWGADQELEECCKWLPKLPPWSADDLRKHRRPKPPSLKDRALQAWAAVEAGTDDQAAMAVIRRAQAALAEPDGPAVSDDREPASVTDQVTAQLHRRATVLLIRKVINQAIHDTASVHWRVADTGEQLVRASDLLAWADHMEKQMEQLID